ETTSVVGGCKSARREEQGLVASRAARHDRKTGHERPAFAAMHGLRPAILGIVLGPWGHRDAAARVHWLARRRRRLAFCIGRTKRRTGRRTMRAIGLVLLSIAIMALLLTDADAKRRSSAQGSQAAGAKGSWCATYPSQGLNDNCGYSSFNQCYQTAVLGR